MSKNNLMWLSAYTILAGLCFILWYYLITTEAMRIDLQQYLRLPLTSYY